METRAPFLVVGAFVLAAIVGVFGFVYWLHNAGGLGARNIYRVQFNGPVPGLLVGAAVLFNGIRVGEVTELALAADDPRRVDAAISVTAGTPVRPDTRVGLDFQGLTGVPVVALEGGSQLTAPDVMPTLVAEPGAGQSMTQAARDALRRMDSVLADNAVPLQSTIENLRIFSEGLAKNTPRIDGILEGVERMTGGGPPAAPKALFDLLAPKTFTQPNVGLKHQFAVPEPTAEVMFDTQKLLVTPSGKDYPGFSDVMWGDTIPKMVQEKVIQSFENFDIAHAPLRAMDGLDADYQLLLDIRNFAVSAETAPVAEIAVSARILDKKGHVVASRLFSEKRPLDVLTPAAASAAFDAAFGGLVTSLIGWTASSI